MLRFIEPVVCFKWWSITIAISKAANISGRGSDEMSLHISYGGAISLLVCNQGHSCTTQLYCVPASIGNDLERDQGR